MLKLGSESFETCQNCLIMSGFFDAPSGCKRRYNQMYTEISLPFWPISFHAGETKIQQRWHNETGDGSCRRSDEIKNNAKTWYG